MAMRIPTKQQMLDAMQTGGKSIDGAKYLVRQVETILQKVKHGINSEALLGRMRKYAEAVEQRFKSKAQPWRGEIVAVSGFQREQENKAIDAAGQLSNTYNDQEKPLQMEIAISDESELVRGYSHDDQAIDADSVQAADAAFTAWLAKNKMVSEDSTLYEMKENGEVLKNERDEPIKADADTVRRLISDEKQGFEQFLRDQDVNISLTQRTYYGEEAEEKLREEIETEIDQIFTEESQANIRSGG